MNTKLKKNDTVVVIAGKYKNKTGRVLRIDHEKGRILVEGVNMVKKAQRRRNRDESGGIIEKEASIAISNVMSTPSRTARPTRLASVSKAGRKCATPRRRGIRSDGGKYTQDGDVVSGLCKGRTDGRVRLSNHDGSSTDREDRP